MLAAIEQWDKRWSATIFGDGRPQLRLWLVVLEYSAHGLIWFPIAVAGLFAFGPAPLWTNLLITLVVDIAAVGLCKAVFRRQRPSYNQDDMLATVLVDRYSFPSGHTTRATMLAMFAATVFATPTATTAAAVWAVAVGLSRIALGRHHVLDVVVGVLVGAAAFAAVLEFFWVAL
eukprot:m.95316 g.95316  ORF g.95316 m.95316 type:complete len:174 (+) comp15149_c0_seq1:46-567(+)